MAGYHKRMITKGKVGELSKIYEEVEEIKDADEQGISLMLLLELSDLVGAVELYLEKYHPTLTLEDLKKMSDTTRRVFEEGHRT